MNNQNSPQDSPKIEQSILKNAQVDGNVIIEKIIQTTQPLPPPSPTGIPQNLPRSGVIKFVGRDEVMRELDQRLQQNQQLVITTLTGMGGIGKTELALQYAYQSFEKKTYLGGICWIRVAGEDPSFQILQFGRSHLSLNPPDDWTLEEQIAFCWRCWREGDVLVIFDDVQEYETVKPALPPSESRFKVLLTTRKQWLGKSFDCLNLTVITEAAAIDLLKSIVGDAAIATEIDEAKKLCAWLGYLPLGLELVGFFLKRRKWSLSRMREALKAQKIKTKAIQQPSGDMTAQRGVTAAFELSWQELATEAQQLGCMLSLFAVAPIPWVLVEGCLPDFNAEDLEELRDEVLVNLSLLNEVGEGVYQLHPLIREFFSGKLEASAWGEKFKQSFCQVMVAIAKEIPQTLTIQDIKAVSLSIPHLEEAATVFQQWLADEDVFSVFQGLGRFYKSQGLYNQAEPWYQQCLELTFSRFGKEHLTIAASLNNLARLYESQGKYEKAEPLHFQALAMSKQLFGDTHPNVAASLNNLALLYCSQKRYEEAEPLYLQALVMRKQLFGDIHPDIATSLNNLAGLYIYQKRYEEVEHLHLQALEMKKQLFRDIHPDIATSLNNLAGLYIYQERYEEAEPPLLQALEMKKQLFGDIHPDIATSLNNLALLYYAQGRYEEAEPLYLQALDIVETTLGTNHPHTVKFRENLAKLREAMEREG